MKLLFMRTWLALKLQSSTQDTLPYLGLKPGWANLWSRLLNSKGKEKGGERVNRFTFPSGNTLPYVPPGNGLPARHANTYSTNRSVNQICSPFLSNLLAND